MLRLFGSFSTPNSTNSGHFNFKGVTNVSHHLHPSLNKEYNEEMGNMLGRIFLILLFFFGLIFFIGSSFLIGPKVIEIIHLPKVTEKLTTKERIKLEKAVFPKKEKTSREFSQVYLSSEKLEQGDTLLVRIENGTRTDEIKGKFNSIKMNFLKIASSNNLISIVGIDARKEPGKYNLVINFPGGEQFKKEIEVVERKFPITELVVTRELEEKGYTPSKIAQDIIAKEGPAIKEVLGIFTEKAYFSKPFIYPLQKIKEVGAFGNIRKSGKYAFYHLGVDLQANSGTPVYAVNEGVVRFSEELPTYGKTLIIDHGLGIFSLYLHLNEFKTIKGKPVKRGEIIALSGNTGYSIEPHLHFSIKINRASVDPLRFIDTIERELK